MLTENKLTAIEEIWLNVFLDAQISMLSWGWVLDCNVGGRVVVGWWGGMGVVGWWGGMVWW